MPEVIVLVGLPGSGKSTWAEAQGVTVLSSDGIRVLLSDDVGNQQIHAAVFETLQYLLRRRLELGARTTIVDATNLLPSHRATWTKLALAAGAGIRAVYFATPLEECLRRNGARARVVPDEAIAEMAAKLVPPAVAEGFSSVTVVRP